MKYATREDRSKAMLSLQTLEGIKITGIIIEIKIIVIVICINLVYSFLEVVPYLLSLEGAGFIFSERFNQDNV